MSRSKRAAREEKQRRREEARRRQVRRNVTTGVVVAVVAVVMIVLVFLTGGDDDGATGNTGATTWDLPALDGDGRVALADFDGTPTVAAFFASWCEVCEDEIPAFAALAADLAGRVDFVGINSQDDGQGLADAEKWGIAGRWPLARDIGGSTGSGLSVGSFSARGLPLTVVYDAAGEVVEVIRGGISAGDLGEILTANFELSP